MRGDGRRGAACLLSGTALQGGLSLRLESWLWRGAGEPRGTDSDCCHVMDGQPPMSSLGAVEVKGNFRQASRPVWAHGR